MAPGVAQFSNPDCATVPPLVVNAARLSVFGFETDRGLAQISAWLFTAVSANSELAYPAVSPSSLWGGGLTARSETLGALVSGDGRSLTLTFEGAGAGAGPCDANYKAAVTESMTAISVAVEEIRNPPASTPVACLAVGYPRSVTVELQRPLGGRVVVDATNAVVSVCPEAGSRGCFYTYPP